MAITKVQGNAKGSSASNSISVTLDSAPISGNVLIMKCAYYGSSGLADVASITQTGVTWTVQAKKTLYGDRGIEIWLGVVSSGASTSITVNLNHAANYGAIADVCEWSGILTSGFLDKIATNSGFGAAATTGTTATTTQADELWIGAIGAYGPYTQSSPINGFTLLDGINVGNVCDGYLYKIVSATGAASSGTTLSGSAWWCGCIATFKASAAPPPAGGILVQVM